MLDSVNYVYIEPEASIRLHLNESPLPLPDFIVSKVIEVLGNCNKYDSKLFVRFRELLANYVGVDVANVYPFLGGDGALRALFYALTEAGDKVTLLRPTYSMYYVFTSNRGLKAEFVKLVEGVNWWYVDLNDLLSSVKSSYLAVIDDPNNPTGSPILRGDEKLISELAEAVKGFLIIDEAYYEFSGYTAVSSIRNHDNVVIVRTLSKAFSLAGFRLGYLVANEELINVISKAYTPFDIPLPSLAAGIAALENAWYYKEVVKAVELRREYLIRELKKLGLRVFNSLTNFVLVKDSRNLKDVLLRHGIAIKYVGDDLYRISVGSKEECSRVIEVLKGYL